MLCSMCGKYVITVLAMLTGKEGVREFDACYIDMSSRTWAGTASAKPLRL